MVKDEEYYQKQLEKMRGKDYVPYSDPRWNDTSRPEVIGHVELTEKQKQEAAEWKKRILKEHEERKKKKG